MLGIDVNVKADKITQPVYFEHKNVCVHCGETGSLVFVDLGGRETTKEIFQFDHMKCTACGKIYSIKWSHPEDNPDIYRPSAVEFSIKRDFKNMFKDRKKLEKVLN